MDMDQMRTHQLIQAALSGLALRQRVIADNVANLATPRFKASAVEFEAALRQALGSAEGLKLTSVPGSVDTPGPIRDDGLARVVTPRGTTLRADGNNVDIDEQMVHLAQTNITYNALAQIMTGRLRSLRSVISEGRR